jgi:hypothetical protein
MPQKEPKPDKQPPESQLLGFPGYRQRDGRSGLDPIDNENELGHMEGSFARALFTLKLRTRNPLYLIAMFLLGVVPTVISIVILIATIGESNNWIPVILMNVVTLPLAINFFLSIFPLLKPRK